MLKAEALLLDFAGVVMREADVTPVLAWERRLGLPEGRLEELRREAVGPGWAGGRSEDEIDERLRSAVGLGEEEFAQLLGDLEGVPLIVPEVEAVVREVRALGGKTGIVRNAGPRWRLRMRAVPWLTELFDVVIVSGEVGVAKPDPRIFSMAAEALGVQPAACVFVDDRAEFVAGAAACGMSVVVMTSAVQGVREMRAAVGL